MTSILSQGSKSELDKELWARYGKRALEEPIQNNIKEVVEKLIAMQYSPKGLTIENPIRVSEYGEYAQHHGDGTSSKDVRVTKMEPCESLQAVSLSGVHGARVVGTEIREVVKITLIE